MQCTVELARSIKEVKRLLNVFNGLLDCETRAVRRGSHAGGGAPEEPTVGSQTTLDDLLSFVSTMHAWFESAGATILESEDGVLVHTRGARERL